MCPHRKEGLKKEKKPFKNTSDGTARPQTNEDKLRLLQMNTERLEKVTRMSTIGEDDTSFEEDFLLLLNRYLYSRDKSRLSAAIASLGPDELRGLEEISSVVSLFY